MRVRLSATSLRQLGVFVKGSGVKEVDQIKIPEWFLQEAGTEVRLIKHFCVSATITLQYFFL